ncbi:DUF1992 domain-containing protein [Georgenia sp. 10Sc9-8]|uniref:DUF1992 domain-containing protein n=1 Tax=Georgenia halotolerans TaxID=3028317 RepID=A0ABT5U0I2_9MICO|nr:DUF1992 domain-containing protein [Georgenia halotolerans]
MTERKPPEMGFGSWVDQQVRAAQERGVFDDLPGAGKPLPGIDGPYDDMWWVKQKIRSEGLSTEALLPTPLALRKEVERLPETVRGLTTEQSVRRTVQDLNQRIAEWLRAPTGPWVPVRPVRTEDVLEQWRAERSAPGPCAGPERVDAGPERADHAGPEADRAVRRPGWWQRLRDRVTARRGRH